ncbi:MAG: adenylate/guanylate cyclase domain-containing protein [Deltaproteobacteria bacterium]|uniref:Adenylate/guanylate cyclase domain-containing protein n=1 Tax=Candidatus Desulfacyla euxinica TaxID=2841693 RepID=A0A8J6N3J8_9DELT|nr:adenylate/guanylate cyclase domain-containing protein [Candidatus Desulfacyla euxinica]
MFEIFSQTDNKIIYAAPDRTILEAMLKAKINHTHVCGGNARCSTCRVYIMDGLSNCQPRNEKEKQLADKLGFPQNIRLACQTKISGNISIRRPVVDELDIEIILKQFDGAPGTKLGQEKDLAILFTDIENYTEFAEALPAYDVVHVLNRYYQTMNEIIIQHKGVISDVAGDGILALFGAIGDSKNPVLDAINAVRAMNAALTQFNGYLNQMYDWSFGIRAGINFGKVIVGNFDTGMMSKISAIGDAVNLASRIETANKDFGTQLLISQSAYEEVQGLVETHKMYRATLKGKSGEYALYEVEI